MLLVGNGGLIASYDPTGRMMCGELGTKSVRIFSLPLYVTYSKFWISLGVGGIGGSLFGKGAGDGAPFLLLARLARKLGREEGEGVVFSSLNMQMGLWAGLG